MAVKRMWAVVSVIFFLLLFPGTSFALPAGFTHEIVVQNLNQPVAMTTLPSGEMLILERQGRILIMDPAQALPSAALYLQLPDVDSEGEKGLLNIALDADFANNQYFYLYYHNAVADRARISRFVHRSDHAELLDEVLIWEDHQTDGLQVIADHWGGGLDVGPDGNIYLTLGDKKDYPNDSQDLSLSAGKIIRIDPAAVDTLGGWVRGGDNSHLIPVSNPFIDGPGGNLDEIWALGLRNPFRAKWDIPTGRLYISEVGGNVQSGPDASYEDLHRVTLADAGVNFGWPQCEGPDCTGTEPVNYSAPVYYALHPDTRALMAGMVYRGSLYPQVYNEAFFMADYQQGWLRYITFDANGDLDPGVPVGGFIFAGDNEMQQPVALQVGPEGAIYYCSISDGVIGRFMFNGGNQPPVITQATADITAAPTAPVTVNFVGVASDPEGDAISYLWDFGDGIQSTISSVAHDYLVNGSYTARLSASDPTGSSLSAPLLVEVGQPPVVTLSEPADGMLFRAGDVISLKGSATDADGVLTNDDLRWSIEFKHDAHLHPVLTDNIGSSCLPTGSSCSSFTVPTSSHGFDGDTGFKVSLRVTDNDGLTREKSVLILPDKVSLTFSSNVPGGVSVNIDQVPRTAPFMVDSLIGFMHTVEVPMTVVASGFRYVFDSWSNSVTSNSQTIVVPDISTTFTANYINAGPQPRVTDNLQVLYAFEAGAGNTVFDVSGVGQPYDLTINNPADVSWQLSALSIDQPTLISSLAGATKLHAAITATNEVTMEAWITPANTTQSGPARIVSLSQDTTARNLTLGQGSSGNTSGDDYDVRLRTTTTGNNGASPSLSSPLGTLSTTLAHVVYTRDAANKARLFIDNVLVASELIDGDLSNWNASFPLTLANEHSADRPWLGSLDLVAIYNRALTTEEISYNYFQGPDSVTGRIPALVVDTAVLPEMLLGAAYSQAVSVSGGIAPYVWSLDSGALPDGLSLDAATGLITGVASLAASFPFTLKVTDVAGAFTSRSFSIAVLIDSDGDGLADDHEINIYGTNPVLADTDGDSLNDGEEINIYLTDALLSDTDSDGLSDGDEVNSYGTDPLLSDTDSDGLSDGDEINSYGTDPLFINMLGDVAPRGAPDGLHNAADVLLVQRMILGLIIPDAGETVLADINQDNILNAGDLVLSVRLSLGLLAAP